MQGDEKEMEGDGENKEWLKRTKVKANGSLLHV